MERLDIISVPRSKRLDAAKLITHRFHLKQILEAYETFANAANEKALKVILTNK